MPHIPLKIAVRVVSVAFCYTDISATGKENKVIEFRYLYR